MRRLFKLSTSIFSAPVSTSSQFLDSSRHRREFSERRRMATASDGGHHQGKSNRLANERSPYLLQHAHNPVDWYPWGPDAFEKAKRENKMIFLSVGYSTCHWCHVMERESFEDARIGKLMNDLFVNIKVDREERPDVDKLYMTFVQATTGSGGWPMSVWLTPDLKPIVGGTYFPPDDSHFGRPGFATVCKYISDKWRENPDSVRQQGDGLAEAIAGLGRLGSGKSAGNLPTPECVDKVYKMIADTFDPQWGGFGSAPKFPQPGKLYALTRYWRYLDTDKHDDKVQVKEWIMKVLSKTLRRMSDGGIHDHVSQGFHRYSTDRKWHVPHFEKMLYDQGQLAVTFAEMFQITKDNFYADILRDILQYVDRDLSHPLGGFYSAEDADSYPTEGAKEKKEGAFCVWTYDDLKRLLEKAVCNGRDTTMADVFIKHYGVKQNGNVDPHGDPHGELKGQNVLIVFGTIEETADEFKLSVDETKEILEQCRQTLFEARQKRPRPHLDTKMLTAWNGLMISGFAKAAAALGDSAYRDRAVKAVEFIRKYLFDSEKGMLLRSCYTEDRAGVIQIPKPIYGFADDYAFLIHALLDLYECTFNNQWLKWATELQEKMDSLFWDNEEHGYFQTAVGDPSIIVRMKEDQDGAEPSANSMATLNLLRLADYLYKQAFRDRAKEVMGAFGDHLKRIPVAVSKMVCGYMYHETGSGQVVIAGSDDEKTNSLADAVNKEFLPFKVLIVLNGKTDAWIKSANKHLNELQPIDGKPTAYVCKNFSCSAPVHEVSDLKKTLGV